MNTISSGLAVANAGCPCACRECGAPSFLAHDSRCRWADPEGASAPARLPPCPDFEAHRARYWPWRARDERDRIAAMTRARNVQAWLEADGDLEENLDPVDVARAKRRILQVTVTLVIAGILFVMVLRWLP